MPNTAYQPSSHYKLLYRVTGGKESLFARVWAKNKTRISVNRTLSVIREQCPDTSSTYFLFSLYLYQIPNFFSGAAGQSDPGESTPPLCEQRLWSLHVVNHFALVLPRFIWWEPNWGACHELGPKHAEVGHKRRNNERQKQLTKWLSYFLIPLHHLSPPHA